MFLNLHTFNMFERTAVRHVSIELEPFKYIILSKTSYLVLVNKLLNIECDLTFPLNLDLRSNTASQTNKSSRLRTY